MSDLTQRLRTVEAKLRAAGLPWMAARVSECIDRECVEPNVDELERVADMAEAQPGLEAENRQMREALERVSAVPTSEPMHAVSTADRLEMACDEMKEIARDTLASLPVQP